MVNLSERAMLVTFSRSQWGAEKTDREVSDELTDLKNADRRTSRVIKNLLPPEALASIKAASSKARDTHYRHTLPWRDKGPRILRSVVYSNYAAAMRDCGRECELAEEELYSKYDVLRDRGIAKLGAMGQKADYPTLAQVKTLFRFDLDVSPIPVGGDFRVDTPDADAIRTDIDRRTNDLAQAGMKAKLAEAAGVVRHMAERLAAYTPGTPGQRATGTFKDTLVENVRELAATLPLINLFEDPEIDAIAGIIQARLCQYEPSVLRERETARDMVRSSAEDIVSRLEGYL